MLMKFKFAGKWEVNYKFTEFCLIHEKCILFILVYFVL